jgi:ABC-type oligopeptide transport system substrate-binding subunit/ABC-type branched-subunit amino acid transport system substrate-binding protein
MKLQKLRFLIYFLMTCALFIFLKGLLLLPEISPEKRGKHISSTNKIVLGIVDSSKENSHFYEGILLAASELNHEGGVLGKKIELLHYDDENASIKGEKIAKTIAKNPDVFAVIGHNNPDIAIMTSVIYKKSGILFFSKGADLTRYGGDFIFRNTQRDIDIADNICHFLYANNLKKIIILYDISSATKRMAELFHEHIRNKDISIVAEKFYSKRDQDYRLLITRIIKDKSFDAIFLAGKPPSAARLIKQIREMGVSEPIIGTDSLDTNKLWIIAGKAAQDTIVCTNFDPNLPRSKTQQFIKKFQNQFAFEPDSYAAQGYDIIKLLADAINKGDSLQAIVINNVLRCMVQWEGVTGLYRLNKNGNIKPMNLYYKKFTNGTFEILDYGKKDDRGFDLVEKITIRLPVNGRISTIDPGLTLDDTSIEITEQLFLGLTDFDHKTFEVTPELATKWDVSQDGLTYRFYLRKDAKWTNGKPVTAHDIVWAIRRNIRPETKCPYVFNLFALKNAEKFNNGKINDIRLLGVKAIDDFTVEFILEEPSAYFPSLAGLWIYRPLPGDVIEKYGDDWTDPNNIQTNASYRLAAWNKGSLMILRKNEMYYNAENVSIPEIRYYVILNNNLGLSMYMNNELDILGGSYLSIPIKKLHMIKSHPVLREQYYKGIRCNVYAYGFNTRMSPVDNPLVRKAIISSIDRSLLVKLVTRGGEQEATTFTPPTIFGAVKPEDGIGLNFDPVQAQKWLKQAGYPDGKGMPEIVLSYNESDINEKIARSLALFLDKYLNIKLKLNAIEWSQFISPSWVPTQMFRLTWSADYPDANNFLSLFHPYKSSNQIKWNNQEYANLIDKAAISDDPNTRLKDYKRAEEILVDQEAVVLPLYYGIAHCLVKERIKGWYYMAMGGQHIRNWSLK